MKWNLSWRTQKNQKEGMVGISETAVSIAMVYGILTDPKPTILAQAFEVAETVEARQAALNKFVLDHALQGVDCSYVLGAHEYNLNLVESPLVAATEVPLAMRWVLRDLITYPVEDATIDIFSVPFPRARDNIKMIYAVAARKENIAKIGALVQSAGLVLKFIDIPELTLKNILIRHPQKFKGCALVYLAGKGGKLILCRDDQLCISRSFELKLDTLGKDSAQDAKTLELLALEFQRSFDYMNSVFRQSIQNLIVLAPTQIDKTLLEGSLKANLGSDIVELKLSEIFKFDKPLEAIDEANYLFATGALLRTEETAP